MKNVEKGKPQRERGVPASSSSLCAWGHLGVNSRSQERTQALGRLLSPAPDWVQVRGWLAASSTDSPWGATFKPNSPSWDTARPVPQAPPEVCGLTQLLPAFTHSLDAHLEVSGDCSRDGIVTHWAHSHTHQSGDPSSVSSNSAGVNYEPLWPLAGDMAVTPPPDGWRLGLCHMPP